MTATESALFLAVRRYAILLSTPHKNFRRWRWDVLRVKHAISDLSKLAESAARERYRQEMH